MTIYILYIKVLKNKLTLEFSRKTYNKRYNRIR